MTVIVTVPDSVFILSSGSGSYVFKPQSLLFGFCIMFMFPRPHLVLHVSVFGFSPSFCLLFLCILPVVLIIIPWLPLVGNLCTFKYKIHILGLDGFNITESAVQKRRGRFWRFRLFLYSSKITKLTTTRSTTKTCRATPPTIFPPSFVCPPV